MDLPFTQARAHFLNRLYDLSMDPGNEDNTLSEDLVTVDGMLDELLKDYTQMIALKIWAADDSVYDDLTAGETWDRAGQFITDLA